MFQSFVGLSRWNVTATTVLKSTQDIQTSHPKLIYSLQKSQVPLFLEKIHQKTLKTLQVPLNHEAAVSQTQNIHCHLHSAKTHLQDKYSVQDYSLCSWLHKDLQWKEFNDKAATAMKSPLVCSMLLSPWLRLSFKSSICVCACTLPVKSLNTTLI